MSKRLFVGGLSYTITDSTLKDLFSKFGTVDSATVITDRYTGQSKGFGFVEMKEEKEADDAIKGLHDTEVEGRKIAVNEARPREERPRNDYNRGGYGRSDNRRGGRTNRSRSW